MNGCICILYRKFTVNQVTPLLKEDDNFFEAEVYVDLPEDAREAKVIVEMKMVSALIII